MHKACAWLAQSPVFKFEVGQLSNWNWKTLANDECHVYTLSENP